MHPVLSSLLSRSLIDRAGGHRRAVLQAHAEGVYVARSSVIQLQSIQNRRLAELLTEARRGVPRFRDLLGGVSAIDPEHARVALAALPVMHRSEIQAEPQRFISEYPGPMFDDATGGSTGTPMRFKVDRATQIARESSLYWSDGLAGWRYGERIAMLWGSDKDVTSALHHLRTKMRWWIDNRRWYNAFNMGEKQMRLFHRGLTRFRPHIIVAYAGSLDQYARYLDAAGLRPTYPLKAIISSAEMLSPFVREQAKSVFGKPVFDRYGNREFGAIATESPMGDGLWVNNRDMLIEIDSPDPVKTPGPIIVTYLANRVMPFVRYHTGDFAMKHPDDPAPGHWATRLTGIVGRESDTIRTRSGRLIHGEFFTHLLYRVPGVQEFQFIQETLGEYRLLIRKGPQYRASGESALIRQIQEEVGEEARVMIEPVESIPLLTSGKRKFTLSLLPRTTVGSN